MRLDDLQRKGADWLAARTRGYLGDVPGFGKTRTALMAAVRAGARRVAVICPAIVRPHWRAEMLEVLTPEGLAPFQMWLDSYQGYVTNAETRALFAAFNPDVLILDEAHFLKHAHSQRTQLLIGPKTGFARHLPHVWPLSGTPMPRNPAELWPVVRSLFSEELRQLNAGLPAAWQITNYLSWLNTFCVWKETEYGIKVFGVRRADILKEFLAKIMLRRTELDGMPDLRWGVIHLGTTPAELKALGKKLDELVTPAEKAALLRGELPSLSPNLAEARHAIGDVKVAGAVDLIASELDAEPDKKLVVFAYHHSVLNVLQSHLREYGVVRVDGTTPPDERERLKQAFYAPHIRVFLGQISACSVGLDGLQQVANDVVIVEPDWSSDVNVQAAKRVNRIGQTRPCLARMLALADTLDTAITKNHAREVQMVADVVDGA